MPHNLAVLGRRTCAVVAAGSAALHGISLINSPIGAPTVLTAAMLVACLYCARHLWVRGALRAWLLVALMNLAMIAIHLPMSAGHHHGTGVSVAPHPPTIMLWAAWLAIVEIAAATAVLFCRTRIPPPAVSLSGSTPAG